MLPNGAHVELAGIPFLLDEDYEQKTGRRCYVHGGRTLFAERTDITGRPGSQNLKPENLQWHITDFDGEGQTVMDNADTDSARLFFRSEGLDLRTSGQARLNKSIAAQYPEDAGASAATKQGDADFSDVTGTSTTSGTDRKLVAVGDKIKSSNHTPGVGKVQLEFYLYKQPFADYATTIQGSAFTLIEGDGATSGTDFKLNPVNGKVRSANLTTTADTNYRCDFYIYAPGGDIYHSLNARVAIVDVTADPNKAVATYDLSVRGSPSVSGPNAVLNFKAYTGRTYRAYVQALGAAGGRGGTNYPTSLALDKIVYGEANSDNTARIEVYDETGAASLKTKDVIVHSSATGNLTASLVFASVAATAYSYRVKRQSGNQAIWVDKVTAKIQTATAWQLDAMEIGYNGKVWLVGSRSGVTSQAWTYDTTNDDWDVQATKVSVANNKVCLQLTQTDAREYALFDNGEIQRFTGAATTAATSASVTGATGIAVTQDRLFVLAEVAGGATIYTYSLDASAAALSSIAVCTSDRSGVDTTARQRMVGTPTGARFFVNYGNMRAEVWEVDASQSGLQKRLVAQLDVGVKATAIAYSGGITYIAGQYLGDTTASDNERKPLSALWIIDQNGVLQRVGYTRRTSTDTNPICFIVPYQNDVFMLQGQFVWRYSLVTGGLYCEYKLDPDTPANARSLAIHKGRVLALYTDEVWVSGTVGTYRQSSLDGGSRLFTSIYDGGLPGVRKSLNTLQVLTTELPTNTAVQVRYAADGGSYTTLATAVSGSRNVFSVSDELNPVTFGSIQLEITLISEDGVSTPTLLGVVLTYSAIDQDEYFDLVLLCEDQDSSFHIDGEQASGTQKADHVIGLWKRGTPFAFYDGYRALPDTTSSGYLVRIEDLRDERTAAGEGRVVTTLRVI